MARAILDPESLPIMGRRWDLVALGLLAALLVFMPAAFGAVEAWSELVVLAIALILALLVAIRPAFDADFQPAWTWRYAPLLLFTALVAFQMVPLPVGLARLIDPAAIDTKTQLVGETAPAAATTTLSYYPPATIECLRLVVIGAIVFATVASVFRRPRQVKELLLVIFVIGCAEAVLAVAQMATGAHQVYWVYPTGMNKLQTSGSFINYSHYCQFMNLSLGAGLAYLLMHLYELRRNERQSTFGGSALARINWEKHGWIFCGIMLAAITVFTSLSRNGAISMLVAAAVVGTLLYRRGTLSWRGWALGLLPLGVFTGLLLFGFDVVYDRLATLSDTRAFSSRWEMTAGALRAWRANPVWGTGLGTHEYVFPMFDESVSPVVAVHADNDYAQLLEETGILGATLVAVFVISMAVLAVKLALYGRTPASAAVYGLGFGLLAVAIHSATDFGQRVPANFVLSATFCGLLVSIDRIEARDRRLRHGKTQSAARSLGQPARYVAVAAAVAALALFGVWALKGAYAAYLGERWWAAALAMDSYIQKAPERADDQDYIDLLAAAENAASAVPANVEYGYWLNLYRWQSLTRAVDRESHETVLHPDALPFVQRIADDLARVRCLAPTFGPPYALEGQLRLFVLEDERGAELMRTGLRLAPYDPPTCLVAGELAAREGNAAEAEALLTRAVELRPEYYREVIELYLSELKRPDLARKLAGDDFWRLNDLADSTAEKADYAHLSAELRARATDSLRRRAVLPDVAALELAALASIDQQQGDLKSAAELYRRALSQEYNRIDWRMQLAEALAAAGEIDDAIHEVRICLRLRPQNSSATALLNKLTTTKRPE